ncbi:MAG: HEAT repeat domain-containing protein, partial [Candidatus Poribacteria bacterium]|nr:HEAT repeat domain-containing protein [Candidatus Poribacteria bacterium]
MSLSVEEILSGLTDIDQPLLDTRLAELSNLSSEGLDYFDDVWSDIDPERRCQVIYRLVELTENNIEMNFDDIFKLRLGDRDDDVRSKAIEGLWENE